MGKEEELKKEALEHLLNPPEMLQVKYIGGYAGVVITVKPNLYFVPGEVKSVSLEVGESLIETGQFEVVKEVRRDAKTFSHR